MSFYSAISWRQVDEKNKEVEDVAKRRDHDWFFLTPRHFTAEKNVCRRSLPFHYDLALLVLFPFERLPRKPRNKQDSRFCLFAFLANILLIHLFIYDCFNGWRGDLLKLGKLDKEVIVTGRKLQ